MHIEVAVCQRYYPVVVMALIAIGAIGYTVSIAISPIAPSK